MLSSSYQLYFQNRDIVSRRSLPSALHTSTSRLGQVSVSSVIDGARVSKNPKRCCVVGVACRFFGKRSAEYVTFAWLAQLARPLFLSTYMGLTLTLENVDGGVAVRKRGEQANYSYRGRPVGWRLPRSTASLCLHQALKRPQPRSRQYLRQHLCQSECNGPARLGYSMIVWNLSIS